MKPGINVVSIFEKKKDEGGKEYFSGTLDVKTLKRIKCDELRVVLMGEEMLPSGLHGLMTNRSSAGKSLVMFAETGVAER